MAQYNLIYLGHINWFNFLTSFEFIPGGGDRQCYMPQRYLIDENYSTHSRNTFIFHNFSQYCSTNNPPRHDTTDTQLLWNTWWRRRQLRRRSPPNKNITGLNCCCSCCCCWFLANVILQYICNKTTFLFEVDNHTKNQ